jgi:hypothetical protein
MNTIRSLGLLRGLTLGLTMVLAPIGLYAQSACPQESRTLNGAYVTHATGSVGGAPIAVVGVTTYDGQGNFTFSATVSFNGNVSKGSGSGTYTVNSDCTGSQNFGPGIAHYDFVVYGGGREITYIQTDPGTVVTVSSTRLGQP